MSAQVAARKQTGWKVVSVLPDVCKTPMGSSTPPVPYPVVALLDECVNEVLSVRANGYPVVAYAKSTVPSTKGDEAGAAKGVKSGTVGGKCWPIGFSKTVRVGKRFLVRHDDEFGMNGS